MSSPRTVAFVTCAAHPDLTPDDRLAAAALPAHGVAVDAVCWDDAGVDWRRYGAVVVRSTWDYHVRLSAFLGWIDRLDALGAPLWNQADILRWNTDKHYLERFAGGPLRPPGTQFLTRGSQVDLAATLEQRGWSRAVIKPAVSADGHSTERTSLGTAVVDQPVLEAMVARGDVVLQELVAEIETEGELSLMFFSGVFSHAVRKRPRPGDFRVQGALAGRSPPPTRRWKRSMRREHCWRPTRPATCTRA